MKNVLYILIMVSLLLSCNSRKNANDANPNGMEDVVIDSMRPDSLHHPSPDEFTDGHTPPPPPDGKHFDGPPPPPPDGKHSDGPPPPPPHGKGRPPHKPDNMRGFDPASEDDMEDNGMSRYMENNDEEGWD